MKLKNRIVLTTIVFVFCLVMDVLMLNKRGLLPLVMFIEKNIGITNYGAFVVAVVFFCMIQLITPVNIVKLFVDITKHNVKYKKIYKCVLSCIVVSSVIALFCSQLLNVFHQCTPFIKVYEKPDYDSKYIEVPRENISLDIHSNSHPINGFLESDKPLCDDAEYIFVPIKNLRSYSYLIG